MTKGLLTTSVGSFPKADWLQQARNKAARGEMSAQELDKLGQKATAYWIKVQDDLGIDILVDGEQYRGDMATYFAENMEGFTISGLVRSYGNRYYKKPIAVGPVGRKNAITIDWWKFAQGLTKKPVKGMLTGPYTIADWSFDEHYSSREAFVMALAQAVHEEALDLEKAGAKYIQIDEPAASVRPEEMKLVAKGLKVVTQGLKAHTITHICYGDFAKVFDDLIKLPVDQLDLETANRNYDILALFKQKKDKFKGEIALGVTDVHSHVIEKKADVIRGIKLGLEALPPERLYIDPDCGLKTRLEDEAIGKLKVMVEAVREVKKELGIE